jgi:hypothetical protein
MTHLPITDDALRSIKSFARGYDNVKSVVDRLRVAMANPNLFIIVAFCAIGLLVTLNVMFRFPDFGINVEQLAQFLG